MIYRGVTRLRCSSPSGEPRTASGLLPFHAYTRDVMFSRFQRLRSALTCAELTNAPSSPGAYAWIHCSSSSSSNGSTDCGEFFAKEKVVGHSGVGYGATAQCECMHTQS